MVTVSAEEVPRLVFGKVAEEKLLTKTERPGLFPASAMVLV
jgi:hypothetical protein